MKLDPETIERRLAGAFDAELPNVQGLRLHVGAERLLRAVLVELAAIVSEALNQEGK